MKINFLNDTWPWFGEHQCYGRLIPYVQALKAAEIKTVETQYSFLSRIQGRAYSIFSGQLSRKDSIFADAERRYLSLIKNFSDPEAVHHILFFDTHTLLFKKWEKVPQNIIATIHHPVLRKLSAEMEDGLKRLSSAIVMHRSAVDFFENYVGKGNVRFIHYGVDTDFFVPAREKRVGGLKPLFFTGQNGRNLKMLKNVFLHLLAKKHLVKLVMLVPEKTRRAKELAELANHELVEWHSRMNESEVREVYQNSYLLLLPLIDSGVNSAIVEALACGLPVVTTDVGGIRDYGGGDIYPIVANDDDEAMAALVEKYLADENWRNEIGKKCRLFAEAKLDWAIIAGEYLAIYRKVSSGI